MCGTLRAKHARARTVTAERKVARFSRFTRADCVWVFSFNQAGIWSWNVHDGDWIYQVTPGVLMHAIRPGLSLLPSWSLAGRDA